MGSQPNPVQRSRAVDLLRGVAVLMVMVAHLPFSSAGLGAVTQNLTVYPPDPLPRWMSLGHYGVQLFLVVSGYCIHIRWARTAQMDTRVPFLAFWKRRLARLYPPYFLALLLSLGATLLSFKLGVVQLQLPTLILDLILLLLLAQNFNDASVRIGNPPFWSLALEEQLYLLYFPLLALRRRKGWAPTLLSVLAVNILWFVVGYLFIPVDWHSVWFRLGPAYWLAWSLGAVAAEAHCGAIVLPRWVSMPLIFVGALTLASLTEGRVRDLLVTCTFFLLLQSTIQQEIDHPGRFEAWWGRVLVRLGEVSYGVYLVHNLAFVISKRALITLDLPDPLILVLRFSAGLLGGYLMYRWVEKPFLAKAQKIPVKLIRAP